MKGMTNEIPVREYGGVCETFHHETSIAIYDCTVLVPHALRRSSTYPRYPQLIRRHLEFIRPVVSGNLGKVMVRSALSFLCHTRFLQALRLTVITPSPTYYSPESLLRRPLTLCNHMVVNCLSGANHLAKYIYGNLNSCSHADLRGYFQLGNWSTLLDLQYLRPFELL